MASSGFAARAQSAGDRWASSHSTTGNSSTQNLADSHTNSSSHTGLSSSNTRSQGKEI
jgi:hypothetical protein